MKTIDEAPFIDIFSDAFQEDPGAIVQPLQQETGIARTPLGAIAIRRELVHKLLGDRRLRSSVLDLVRLQGVNDGLIFDLMSSSLLVAEGDAHLRLRKLVNRAFTPRAVDPHRSMMRGILESLVEPVRRRGECEFMAEIADHYPILVMCQLLGVPEEDHEDFAAWNKASTWVLSFELSTHREEAEWGTRGMNDYVTELIAKRRSAPRHDMVSELVQIEEDGDRLSDLELRSLIAGLLFAGFDTTRNQLGLAMALFAEHPDQWKLLGSQPELVPRAVEEVLRYQGAVSVSPRVTTEDMVIDEYFLPEGTLLSLSLASANFDGAAYDDAATFDISAVREPQMTFGGGAHYCLGANLARAEMQEALTVLSEAMPDIELAGDPVWRTPFGIFGPDYLSLRFAPTAAAAAEPA